MPVGSYLIATREAVAWRRVRSSHLIRIACAALLISFSSWLKAQLPSRGGQQVIHQSWTFKDGAPEQVRAFAQTADGYLWVGAESGLYRFDGFRFELFHSPFGDQLQSNNILALFAPAGGGLWVGYIFGGFSIIKAGRVTNFPEPSGSVFRLANDGSGIVWAATAGGLWRFENASWKRIGGEWNYPKGWSGSLGFDREGILWAISGSSSSKLFFLLPGAKQFQKAGENLSADDFTFDADGHVLTTHEKPGPESAPGNELETALPAYPILRGHSRQVVDRQSSIWFFPFGGHNIYRHSAAEPLRDVVRSASGENSEVYEISYERHAWLVDREGGLWLGDQPGVHRFSYSPLMEQKLPKSPGPYFSLAPDEAGVVWIAASDGVDHSSLYRVADGKITFEKSQAGGASFAYAAPDKTFWFGGSGGLWHLVHGSLTRVQLPQGMADEARNLVTITQDRSEGLWLSFGLRGLYLLKDGAWIKNGGRPDLTPGVVIEFTDHLGRVWFGYTNNKLAVLDQGRVQTFGSKDGVHVGNVTAIYGRDTSIWIGGEFGLQRFDGRKFESINPINRDWFRGISGTVETANGDLWLCGLGGVIHLLHSEITAALANPAYQVRAERFGRQEGLPGLPSQLRYMPTANEASDGRLWFNVNNGVVWIDPARAFRKEPPPAVVIESISGDDKTYPLDRPLRLPARTSTVQITYASVSLLDPESVRFRSKLQEVDKDWHEAGTANSVTYRNLSPGSYHFAVNRTDSNGVWSDNTATREFTVLPAFYQTNWFRALAAVIVLAMVWGLYRLRLLQVSREFNAQLEGRVDERLRVARELHDTLLQSFQGMLPFLQSARNRFAKGGDGLEVLDQALALGDQAIREGREAIQGMRSSTKIKNELAQAVQAVGDELGTEGSAKFRVVVEGSPRDLHPILRDEVYGIAREAMRNAFNHAEAKLIEAEITYGDDLRLRIRDDGKGIDLEILKDGRTGHYGLPGMRERAARIGGKLTVWSAVGAGTEIELRVPGSKAFGTSGPPSLMTFFRRGKSQKKVAAGDRHGA